MNQKIAGRVRKQHFVYLLFFAVIAVYHIFIKVNFGDDIFFGNVLENMSLLEFLKSRYVTWSSRLLIEGLLVPLSTINPIVWKVCDTFVCVSIIYCLNRLMKFDNKFFGALMTCGFFLLYPFIHMSTAGWIATTLNYLWPFAAMLITLLSVRKMADGEKIRWYEYILFTVSLLFAANQEQVAAILLVILSVFCVYFLTKKKFFPYLYVQLGLTVASLIFILTCPGNDRRMADEIATWMPNFDQLSLIDKAYLGVSTTINHFLEQPNSVFILFCAVLAFMVFVKNRNWFVRLVSLVPVCTAVIYGYLRGYFAEIWNWSANIFNLANPFTAENYMHPTLYIPLILYIVVIGCIVASVYAVFKNTFDSIFTMMILGCGLMSRVVMGFSPTLYASSARTLIFLYFAFIFAALWMIYKNRDCFQIKTRTNVICLALGVPALFHVVSTVATLFSM